MHAFLESGFGQGYMADIDSLMMIDPPTFDNDKLILPDLDVHDDSALGFNKDNTSLPVPFFDTNSSFTPSPYTTGSFTTTSDLVKSFQQDHILAGPTLFTPTPPVKNTPVETLSPEPSKKLWKPTSAITQPKRKSKANITSSKNGSKSRPSLNVGAHQLNPQILLRLLTNAHKYAKEKELEHESLLLSPTYKAGLMARARVRWFLVIQRVFDTPTIAHEVVTAKPNPYECMKSLIKTMLPLATCPEPLGVGLIPSSGKDEYNYTDHNQMDHTRVIQVPAVYQDLVRCHLLETVNDIARILPSPQRGHSDCSVQGCMRMDLCTVCSDARGHYILDELKNFKHGVGTWDDIEAESRLFLPIEDIEDADYAINHPPKFHFEPNRFREDRIWLDLFQKLKIPHTKDSSLSLTSQPSYLAWKSRMDGLFEVALPDPTLGPSHLFDAAI